MKNLLFDTGGRPRANDDLQTLQGELQYAINAQFFGLPACVVHGCEVYYQSADRYNIGHGLVYINGGIHRFNGVSNVTLPLELYLGPEELTDLRPYQTGGSKACMGEQKVLTRAVSGSGESIRVTSDGTLHFSKAREALFRAPAEIGMVADFPAEYDSTGKGKYGTNAYGWALCNGSNGTPNMLGRFPVGYGSNGGDYDATRKTGGAASVALTADQGPEHTHTMEQAGAHVHGFSNWQLNYKADRSDSGSREWAPDPGIRNTAFQTQSSGSHVHVIQTSGKGEPHENRPPYMVLAFRMWIGF